MRVLVKAICATNILALSCCLICVSAQSAHKEKQIDEPGKHDEKVLIGSEWGKSDTTVSRSYCQLVMEKVDQIVRQNLYSEDLAKTVWPKALSECKEEIPNCKTLAELSQAMNKPIHALNSSHCQFVTINDETYHFLHSLFSSFNHRLRKPDMDFTGMVLGGLKFAPNQIRYIIDGSPAAASGLRIGDCIESIDGERYVGQENFFNKAGKPVKLSVKRADEHLTVSMTPVRKAAYKGYIDGTKKSARTIKTLAGDLGYIHIWAGGQPSHNAFEETLADKLLHTNGLILDLRDGYGGNALEDLDFFYRPAKAYPVFTTKTRDGKKDVSQSFYDKPVVAIINGGARSGRELLAYSLKNSKRAPLVGEKTAGYVLAGRLFPIDKRCSLYLAVADCDIDNVRLEGKGVTPDVEIANPECNQAGYENQTEKAKELLLGIIRPKTVKDDCGESAKPQHE